MRIVVDEDLPIAVAELLRQYGHDASHIRELGMCGASDASVLRKAAEMQAITMTADLHFSDLQTVPFGGHTGVIVLRFPDYFRQRASCSL